MTALASHWRAVVRALRLSASLTVIVASGCGFGSGDPSFAPGNDCGTSADCVQGVCDEGFCVDMTTGTVELVVEVLRSSADAFQATPESWVYPPEPFSGVENRNLTLPPTREVAGTVRWKGQPIPASVRFTQRMPDALSALNTASVEVDTLRGAAGDSSGDEVDYSTTLVLGQTYDVVVLPSSDTINTVDATAPAVRTLPPVYATIEVEQVLSVQPFRFDVSFPETLETECGEGELTGCLLTGQMLSFDGETATAAAQLQVRAIEKESGRVVSSIAETDDEGRYGIRVSPDAEPYILRVTSSAGATEPFPSVSLDPEIVFEDDPIERQVFIPRVETALLTGLVQDARFRPVPGATVRLEATGIFDESALGIEGTFRATVNTVEGGVFTAQLLPGVYEIIVTPPADAANAWAPGTSDVVVVAGFPEATDSPIVTLGAQTTLSGSCATFAGEAASGVTIAARARGEIGGLQRSQETVSAESGNYEMKVDGGLYDLLIKVSDSTGFPWLVDPGFAIDPTAERTTRDWELPPPIVVRGRVATTSGTGISGAPIRAYVLIDDNPLLSGSAKRSIQVAESVTMEDGVYQLLISPSAGGL